MRRSVRLAMVPVIDGRKTMPVVFLPGAMTGMILAGVLVLVAFGRASELEHDDRVRGLVATPLWAIGNDVMANVVVVAPRSHPDTTHSLVFEELRHISTSVACRRR